MKNFGLGHLLNGPGKHKRAKHAKGFCSFFMLALFIALQFSGFTAMLPQFSPSAPRTDHCNGNHAECGCSPESIAAKSCCCFKQARVDKADINSDCCEGKDSTHPASCQREPSTRTVSEDELQVRVAPCGKGTKSLGFSIDKLDFAYYSPCGQNHLKLFSSQISADIKELIGIYLNPDVPPPKAS